MWDLFLFLFSKSLAHVQCIVVDKITNADVHTKSMDVDKKIIF